MARGQKPEPSTDRKKWAKILEVLVRMLRTQEKQIESLVMEKKVLEDCISRQCERWVFDNLLHNDQIYQMKREFSILDLFSAHEEAEHDLLLSLKLRESVIYKLKLGHLESELADFREWVDCLSHRCSNAEDISTGKLMVELNGLNGRGDGYLNSISSINGEAQKDEIEKDEEISRLSKENQQLIEQLDTINEKKAQAIALLENEKASLLASVEQLRSENGKKDGIIRALEAENVEKDGEISRLSKELKMSKKKPANAPVMPVLSHCPTKGSRKSCINGCTVVKKELNYASSLVPKSGKGLFKDGAIWTLEAAKAKKAGEIFRLSKELELPKKKLMNTANKDREIFRRCKELELLRKKPMDTLVMPVPRNINGSSIVVVKKELDDVWQKHKPGKGSEKGSQSLKRNGADAGIFFFQMLFSSAFKVPKLKSSSSPLAA